MSTVVEQLLREDGSVSGITVDTGNGIVAITGNIAVVEDETLIEAGMFVVRINPPHGRALLIAVHL